MATTIVPKYDEPLSMTAEEIRDTARAFLISVQGDCDKSGDIEDASYYQGQVDALTDILFAMTFPAGPETARECQHGNLVWRGNECGLCEGEGYVWASPQSADEFAQHMRRARTITDKDLA